MFDVNTLERKTVNSFIAKDGDSLVEITELFPQDKWDCPEAFHMSGIVGYEPMTAKELDTEEKQDKAMSDTNNIMEEKFDGTRALLYFLSQEDVEGNEVGFCRIFSRRISKKTDFYVENTDSLPHLRELDVPELSGTIIDGEMFIEGLPFKDVSSTLNCLWDKAIDRQIEKGFITLHAFDILFYKGIDLRRMSLNRRKQYLKLVVEEARSKYIKEVTYYNCAPKMGITVVDAMRERKVDSAVMNKICNEYEGTYPNLVRSYRIGDLMTPRAYYELIVATGGEGLIVKPKNGKYLHKRGWEYSKVKKFLTRELIVMGFEEPTKEYTGKDIKKWAYWVDKNDKRYIGNFWGDKNYIPVTKYYYYNQVGVMRLGVIINKADYEMMAPNKRGDVIDAYDFFDTTNTHYLGWYVMCVCECSGMTDEEREYFTKNREKMIGSVVEVRANELFKDSGRLRHPRYMRSRFDKYAEQCTWSDHIGAEI